MSDQPSVHIGTSSWLFDAWRGVFYPDKLPKSQYLTYYVSQFDTVEVNTSFYAIPSPATLLTWVESAPPGFTYALKFPRTITHERRLVDCEAITRVFLDSLRALGDACGPAFLQFPPDFTRRSHGRNLATFLDWLANEAHDLRLAVEVRAADLMTPAFAAFLAERNFALVLADRVQTPDLFDVWWEQVTTDAGPDFAFIRWIGDDRTGPQGDRELQLLRDADLTLWAGRILRLWAQGKSVFGYMHNPYEGHAPASVRRLKALLAPHIELPAWPLAAAPGQLSLL
ncbi:MAG TPA: DUF72 domain-containing protein [Chloroflexi bacterium]|nr:DUF72 domain-containing protein [Chloroflexota bacterium]